MLGKRDDKTDRERYLEDELDRYREAEDRRQRESSAERERRRQEMRERIEEAERSADTWPEALHKQVHLMRREVTGHPDVADIDAYFENSAIACEEAQQHWRELEAAAVDQIKALEAQIEALQDGIRLGVAERLEAVDRNEWHQVAAALREMSPWQFLQW